MNDTTITLALVAAFAALCAAHVATLFGLLKARRVGRALAALVVPPLAPFWAFSGGMRVRGGVWVASAALYVAAFAAARS